MVNKNLVYVELPKGGTARVGASFAKSKGLTVVDAPEKLSRKEQRIENVEQGIPQTMVDAGTSTEPLKGEALNEALRELGLPTAGRVPAKQARLAEHLAAQAGDTTQTGIAPDPQTPAVIDGGGTPDTE